VKRDADEDMDYLRVGRNDESRTQQNSAKSSVTKRDSLKTRPLFPAGSYRTFGVRNCSISKNRLVTSLEIR